MTTTQELHTGLHSLVIFRGLLENEVLCALDALLCTDVNDVCATVDAYCTFAQALFVYTDDFSDYLRKAVLDDENLYIHTCCRGEPISTHLSDCLMAELRFLERLSQFDGAEIRAALAYDGFLPTWGVERYNLVALYRSRMTNLSRHGYGIYAKYHVFTVRDEQIVPVRYPDPQRLDELSGYERERGLVLSNTRALLEGRPASNILLYGDAGTGKSSTVKAVANALASEGLRLIEIKRHQLYQIPDLVEALAHNPLKFILFIDDLSFSAGDSDFAALKAILEGSVSSRSANLVVYATSNRRHLVKETFSERAGDDIHLADTMEEMLSLSARFGLVITFSRPDKDIYADIVKALAAQRGLDIPQDELLRKAEAHALRSGGRSPRVAKQLIELLQAGDML